jgi:hypothetical protein
LASTADKKICSHTSNGGKNEFPGNGTIDILGGIADKEPFTGFILLGSRSCRLSLRVSEPFSEGAIFGKKKTFFELTGNAVKNC